MARIHESAKKLRVDARWPPGKTERLGIDDLCSDQRAILTR